MRFHVFSFFFSVLCSWIFVHLKKKADPDRKRLDFLNSSPHTYVEEVTLWKYLQIHKCIGQKEGVVSGTTVVLLLPCRGDAVFLCKSTSTWCSKSGHYQESVIRIYLRHYSRTVQPKCLKAAAHTHEIGLLSLKINFSRSLKYSNFMLSAKLLQ